MRRLIKAHLVNRSNRTGSHQFCKPCTQHDLPPESSSFASVYQQGVLPRSLPCYRLLPTLSLASLDLSPVSATGGNIFKGLLKHFFSLSLTRQLLIKVYGVVHFRFVLNAHC